MTPKQRLDALLKVFAPEIQAAFLEAIANITNNAVIAELAEAIERGDVDTTYRLLGISPAAMRPLTAAIESAYERAGIATGQTFPRVLVTPIGKAVFHFDVRNIRAEQYLRMHSADLVTRIGIETKENVRRLMTDAMVRGVNPRTTALDIVGRIDPSTKQRVGGVVGLSKQGEIWADAARNRLEDLDEAYFRMELRDKRFDRTVEAAIKAGKPLSRDTVQKLVTRYKDNALRFRGESIGRTEAMQSLNAAEYEATLQAVEMGATVPEAVQREWDSAGDGRVRWSHRRLNGERVGLKEPFVSPSGARMLYPGDTSLGAGANEIVGCRCRVRSVIDWLYGVE